MNAPAPNSSDEELVLHLRRWPQDEIRVIDLLYRRHRKPAMNVATRCLASFRIDPDHSRDIVQNVFVRLPRTLPSLREPNRFSGYLSSIVYRTTLIHCRTHCRCDSVDPSELDRVLAPRPSICGFTREEAVEVLASRLKAKEFRIVMMYAIEGYSCSEIADRESIGESTVRWYIGRARKALRGVVVSIK